MDGFPALIGTGYNDQYAEGSTIAVDSNETVWICYDLSPGGADGYKSDGSIEVIHSISDDHSSFSEPLTLLESIKSDDIAKIVAWDEKIGVFISDQARWEFRFFWRKDSDSADEWPNTEWAEQSDGNTDDHINYACNPATGELN